MSFGDVSASLEAGAFDARDDRHLSRTPLVFDELAWKQMNQELNEQVERALDLQAEAAERLSKSGEDGVSVRMILMGFETGKEEAEERK